jgi:hypothetical protein
MRPSLKQIYNDPLKIIEALKEAGVESAHEKVMGIMLRLCEYWSVEKHLKRYIKTRTELEQCELAARNPKGDLPATKPFDQSRFMMDIKRSKEYNANILNMRSYLNKMARCLETKIDKWPDLDLDPSTLRKKPDNKLNKKILGKQKRRHWSRNIYWY